MEKKVKKNRRSFSIFYIRFIYFSYLCAFICFGIRTIQQYWNTLFHPKKKQKQTPFTIYRCMLIPNTRYINARETVKMLRVTKEEKEQKYSRRTPTKLRKISKFICIHNIRSSADLFEITKLLIIPKNGYLYVWFGSYRFFVLFLSCLVWVDFPYFFSVADFFFKYKFRVMFYTLVVLYQKTGVHEMHHHRWNIAMFSFWIYLYRLFIRFFLFC